MMRFGVYSLAPLTGLGNTIAYRLRGFYRPYAGVSLRSTACLWSGAPAGLGNVIARRLQGFHRLYAGVPLRSTACRWSGAPDGANNRIVVYGQ